MTLEQQKKLAENEKLAEQVLNKDDLIECNYTYSCEVLLRNRGRMDCFNPPYLRGVGCPRWDRLKKLQKEARK